MRLSNDYYKCNKYLNTYYMIFNLNRKINVKVERSNTHCQPKVLKLE